MRNGTPVVRMCRWTGTLACGLALIVLLQGCAGGGESAVVKKSKRVFVEQMQPNSDHAAYGLAIAAKSSSPFARELIVEWISSDNYPTALEAVKAIAAEPPEEAREALTGVFNAKKGLLKLNAAIALARMGDEAALAFVRKEVVEGGGTLTEPAVTLLAAQGDDEELKSLLGARLKSDDLSIRNEAYGLLGQIKQPWSTALLFQGLKDEFGEERVGPITALGLSGDPAVAKEIAKYVDTRGLVFASLEALGQLGNADYLDAVKKQLDHRNPLVRSYAAAATWRLGDKEAALEVQEALMGDGNPDVRMNLAQQIRGIDDPSAIELLTRLLEDESSDVRLSSVVSLGMLEDPALEPVLLGTLSDASYSISTTALEYLGEQGSAAAVEQIAPLLDNRVSYVQMSAANAILSIEARENAAGA